jgi:3-oxoadipate enol-lactonase
MLAQCLTLVEDGASTASPLLLIHALGTESSIWDQVIPGLAAKTRVIRIDLPGHGRSPPSRDPYSLDNLIRAILDRVDAIGVRRFAIGGVSVGGIIAQAMAIRYHERVTHLVLSNTAAKIGSWETWSARYRQVSERGLSALAPQLARRWVSADFAKQQPKVVEHLIARLAVISVPGYLHAVLLLRDSDFRSELSMIACPTLIIHGEKDPVISLEEARALRQGIRHSRLAVLNCAHLACLEQPTEFVDHVSNFLGSFAYSCDRVR